MPKLTDIKSPDARLYTGPQPHKKHFLKKLIGWLVAPIVWPIKLVYIAARWLLKTLMSAIKNIVRNCLPTSWAAWLVLILAIIVIWQILIPTGLLPSFAFPSVDQNKWQAVFLTNSQVYFGHLQEIGKDYVALKEVYYLRQGQGGQTAVDLVKLGNEIHNPEQTMYIPKDKIVFWENLKPESQVIQVINRMRVNP